MATFQVQANIHKWLVFCHNGQRRYRPSSYLMSLRRWNLNPQLLLLQTRTAYSFSLKILWYENAFIFFLKPVSFYASPCGLMKLTIHCSKNLITKAISLLRHLRAWGPTGAVWWLNLLPLHLNSKSHHMVNRYVSYFNLSLINLEYTFFHFLAGIHIHITHHF